MSQISYVNVVRNQYLDKWDQAWRGFTLTAIKTKRDSEIFFVTT